MYRLLIGGLLIGSVCLPTEGAHLAKTITENLYNGTGAENWDTARNASRLRREFSFSSLRYDAKAKALHWQFVPKSVGFNDIFLRREVRRPFDTLTFEVRNLGAPFALAAKVQDADGAEWTANIVPLKTGDQWVRVNFPRRDWKPASWSHDADGNLDFPLAYVTVIAFDVKHGKHYDLLIRRISLQSPEPPAAELRNVRLPARIVAGGEASVHFEFKLNRPCRLPSASLCFGSRDAPSFRVPLSLAASVEKIPPEKWTVVDMAFPVPLYARGGRLDVFADIGDARTHLPGGKLDAPLGQIFLQARKPGTTVAVVKPHNGTPTLYINGSPYNGMTYTAYRPAVPVFTDFTQAGVNLFSICATPTQAGYGLSRTAWTAPNTYDFSQLDQRVMMILKANPHAYIFPRLYLHAPKWWTKAHPDQVVLYDPGDGHPVPFISSGGLPAPSWASEIWRRDTIEGLRRLIHHVETSPYADRIIGYHLTSGTTEEWMMWGANEGAWVDYSPPNVARFRQWLRRRYTTVEALRKAWHQNDVDFDTAQIPSRKQRETAFFGALRLPSKEQSVIDFYLYNSQLVANTICTFAHAVKEMTHRRKIVGVFYGYILQLCGEQRQQNAGHLALQRVLASPDVDFLCSPTSYAFRQLGGAGTSHFMSLLGSVKLHGKLWFDENDIRTSLSPGKIGAWGKPANIAGDFLQQDKELSDVLVNGAAQWWFDVGSNRYDNPALMRHLAGWVKAATKAMAVQRQPVDQIAFAVDEDSLVYLKTGHPLGRWLLLAQIPALRRIGAPVGDYLTDDLDRLGNHRMIILPTSFAPDRQQRQAVDALKGNGRVLLFLYAPGLYRDGSPDAGAMASFTGIHLALKRNPVPLHVTIAEAPDLPPALRGTAYGPEARVSPHVVVDDPNATVLGRLADGSAALAIRRYPTWTAVFSAAPLLPANLLRYLAGLAKVHFYTKAGDVVWASTDLVSLSVNAPGPREIHLPRKADVTDLYTGRQIAHDTDTFQVDMPAKATRTFVLH